MVHNSAKNNISLGDFLHKHAVLSFMENKVGINVIAQGWFLTS